MTRLPSTKFSILNGENYSRKTETPSTVNVTSLFVLFKMLGFTSFNYSSITAKFGMLETLNLLPG